MFRLIEELPEHQRVAIRQSMVMPSNIEAAAALGLELSTYRARLLKARKAIREAFTVSAAE